MRGPVKTLLFGLTDLRQAREVGALGVDAVVLAVGGAGPLQVSPEAAVEIAAALPPLMARFALVTPGVPTPKGFSGAVTGPKDRRPAGAVSRIVRLSQDVFRAGLAPADADAWWLQPGAGGSSSATRFDFERLVASGRGLRVILEIPDASAGVETAIRLGQPYGVLFGEGVWFHPGIVDLDVLERALAIVTRLNKAAYSTEA